MKLSPAHLDAEHFAASDRKVMPYTRWPADQTKPAHPRAAIICVHGLSGAASDFWPAGEMFSTKNIAVYGMQLRGMGNDPDKPARGDIPNAQRWVDDLLEFTKEVKRRHPGLPVFWHGESLGSLVVIHTLEQLDDQSKIVNGVILSSPVIGFREDLPWWKYAALRALIAVNPKKRISLESLGNGEVKVTNNSTHKEQMQKTAHYVEFFTLRLFRAVDKMVRNSDKSAGTIKIPTLLLYTPNDVFTAPAQLEDFFRRIPAKDKSSVIFEKSYHLILHDVERQKALDELDKWIEKKLKQR